MLNKLFKKQKTKHAQHCPCFGYYMRNYEDNKTITILVDLALKDIAPDENFPYCFLLKVPYEVQRADGLLTVEQLDDLVQIEDNVLQIAQDTVPYYHFATITQDGFRYIALYCPSQQSINPFEKALRKHFGAKAEKFQFEEYSDKEWTTYLEDIYPLPFQLQEINNHAVVQKLKESGDQSEKSRPISHFVYFKKEQKENVELYKKWLQENDFELISEEPLDSGEIQLNFSRNDAPNFYAINDICLPLWEYAAQLGGKYDGWETEVVR